MPIDFGMDTCNFMYQLCSDSHIPSCLMVLLLVYLKPHDIVMNIQRIGPLYKCSVCDINKLESLAVGSNYKIAVDVLGMDVHLDNRLLKFPCRKLFEQAPECLKFSLHVTRSLYWASLPRWYPYKHTVSLPPIVARGCKPNLCSWKRPFEGIK